jgi:hypothetical protein
LNSCVVISMLLLVIALQQVSQSAVQLFGF